MSALYIHIPFCISKCFYCCFCSFDDQQPLHGNYVAALQSELSGIADQQSTAMLNSLFVGGGTPTCLDPKLLCAVLDHCFDVFTFAKGAELSVETNPGTVDINYLKKLRNSGVNRLSIGAQSLHDTELRVLGRPHNSSQALRTVELAKQAGFTNINLDLMYGIPGQSASSWKGSLEDAVKAGPQHLSLYQMSVEPGTKMKMLVDSNSLKLPGEEEVLEMDRVTEEICYSHGYDHYEISNYCQPGYRCRHNITYWLNRDYYGAGASAVSYLNGVRAKRISDPAAYIEAVTGGQNSVIEKEKLSHEETFRETVVMGLRMTEGVSRETLWDRFSLDLGEYYGATLKKLLDQGMVDLTPSRLYITPKGQPFSNQIMADLV